MLKILMKISSSVDKILFKSANRAGMFRMQQAVAFNRIVWCAGSSPIFAAGIVNGYFDDEVPLEFWKMLALYKLRVLFINHKSIISMVYN